MLGYIQNPDRFSDALAFAYFHRVAPVFHEVIAYETYDSDPFDEVYAVKRDFINEVLKYIDECDHAGDYDALGFYKLEDKFGGYKTNRMELLYALEYIRIDGRFGDEVWKAIESNAPAEANSIEATFSPKRLDFH
ncbi:MAG: hypothetical protein RLN99_14055 [Kiloniellaceae bacterium]